MQTTETIGELAHIDFGVVMLACLGQIHFTQSKEKLGLGACIVNVNGKNIASFVPSV